MSKIVDILAKGSGLPGAGNVKPNKMGVKRFPFIFLIDVSGSTGLPPDPDIDHINQAMATLLDMLKKPTPSSELAQHVDQIDVTILAYSDNVTQYLDWSTVENLPASIPPMQPLNGTATGKALEAALEKVAERLRYYRDPSRKIPFGMPHILHLTDGAMNDTKPGEPRWNEIKDRLTQIDGRANPEKKYATLLNFISPKGLIADWVEIEGQKMSGKELLQQLSGEKSVYEMGSEIHTFQELVKLITVVITKITKNLSAKQALDQARTETGTDKRTKVKIGEAAARA
ncbi:vWA domain-containing protein [Hyphomicrobium sp. DY-1]|uniref:vWA domain-containing protein n=1 Tax=Hyphomicrobium sp. DY-1 TaxID=3075650 RepID=UPI0039C2A318